MPHIQSKGSSVGEFSQRLQNLRVFNEYRRTAYAVWATELLVIVILALDKILHTP